MYWTPGPLNSILISTENAVPNKPENKANIKYKVPISFAFEDKNHLSAHSDIALFCSERFRLPASEVAEEFISILVCRWLAGKHDKRDTILKHKIKF